MTMQMDISKGKPEPKRGVRISSNINTTKISCLAEHSGKERLRVECRERDRRSIITGRVHFNPNRHRVDLQIYLHSYGSGGYEFGIACALDGKYCIDLVAENWVIPVQLHGTWECADCYETGYADAEEGYRKATFKTREALLLDHMGPVLRAIAYLHTHTHVEVYLHNPNDPGHSSSCVWLREPKSGHALLIAIGKIELDPCENKNDVVTRWIHHRLASELALF